MLTIAKIKGVSIEAGKRILKVLQFGTKTENESGPFGIDSSPLKDYVAVYGGTSNISAPVIIVYIQKSQIS